ncbi:MAG: hypothetical protein ACD_63C00017G0002 [uncultured bacterium]|nr:MAG: hypothetical protein ACD_63C00017G0002 [uncultured bacterium]
MSRKRQPMRQIKEVLRLSQNLGLGDRVVEVSTGIARTTIRDYIDRFVLTGLTWKELSGMNEEEIENHLFPQSTTSYPKSQRPLGDWPLIHTELRRKGVTLQLLWEEYLEKHPDGYRYSRFCELYQEFSKVIDTSMRQVHRAGEKLFVDYSGLTVPVIDHAAKVARNAQIFVAVMGASNYCYAEATWTQTIPDWIGSHVRAFNFLSGCTQLIVPDNLKSGVNKADFYDPEINVTYQKFAEHYGVAILPARAARPRDKAKVECGVLVVQRWILARLRNRQFFSLSELNAEIQRLLTHLNERPFRKLTGCRRSMFDELDKPCLIALPTTAYEFGEWSFARVNIDYHIEFEKHYYSVPYILVRQKLDVHATASVVEIYKDGIRVAVHGRSSIKHAYTTLKEHMPPNHLAVANWTPERLADWARQYGPFVVSLSEAIMNGKKHPQQGFRACLGVLRLETKVGKDRLNAACERALYIGGINLQTVRAILQNGQDRLPMPKEDPVQAPELHENVRGPGYFCQDTTEDNEDASAHD